MPNNRTSRTGDQKTFTSRGFTLIEMLIVITIIAVLVALLLPSIKRSKALVRKIQCQSNLRQWVNATIVYQDVNRGIMPYSVIQDGENRWWGAWYDSDGNLEEYAVKTSRDYGLNCPDRSIREGGYGNYPGYHMSSNVNTRCWTTVPHHRNAPFTAHLDDFIQFSRITLPSKTPFFYDASGWGGSIYSSALGSASSIGSYTDVKFRHDGYLNLVMLDAHAEDIPGTYTGESSPPWDEPRVWENLYAEGRPYLWHYPRDPYRLY